ncbi:MAG: hypothetical protein ACP5OP_07030 [Leptospirillia bacterium]
MASVILPATLLPGQGGSSSSTHPESLAVLPLPQGAKIRSADTFGEGAAGHYYFFDGRDRLRLFSLTLTHPMGARDLWMESWHPVRVPALRGQERLRTAAVGMNHLFLAGEDAGGAPFIRSYQIGFKDPESRTTPILMGRVDYFPKADTTPVRRLYFDQKSKILWLGYDSGRIESGNPYLVLNDRILWTDPAGYLPLPNETALSRGPSPLLTPKSLSKGPDDCFSCRYYLVSREEPDRQSRPSLPVRAPENLDSSLGMLPMGGGMGLFMGRQAFVCRVPDPGPHARIKKCTPISLKDLPVAATWWGNRLAYLFPPGRFSFAQKQWAIFSVNPALIDDDLVRISPGKRFAFRKLLSISGQHYLLPQGSDPRPQTFSSDGRRLVLFGQRHLYLIDAHPIPPKDRPAATGQ